MAAHTILLVEDDENTRLRLAEAIQAHEDLTLRGSVGNFADAMAELDAGPPEVLLTDIGLPDGSGIDLIREVRARGFDTQPMVITVFGDEKHVVAAIEAGALGYLLKDGSADYIGRSILDLVDGGSPISPPIARYFLRRFRTIEAETPAGREAVAAARDAAGGAGAAPTSGASDVPHLTRREREVLTLIVKGFTYAEAAGLVGVAESTVTSHIRNIYRKLEVHSRGEAVYEALQLGLVKVDE